MYDTSSNSTNSNSNNTPREKKDFVLSPIEIRENRRKAPATPPSPPPHHLGKKLKFKRGGDPKEIPWGDRKQAAKPMSKPAYEYTESDIDIEVDIEEILSNSKDGVLFPKNSPLKNKTVPSNDFVSEPPEKANGSDKSNDSNSNSNSNSSQSNKNKNKNKTKKKNKNKQGSGNGDRMSKRELFWAAFVFVLIVLLTVVTTAVVMTRHNGNTQENNASMSKGNNKNKNGDGNGMTPSPTKTPPNSPPSTNGGSDGRPGTTQSQNTISIEEEWELVHSAIRNNNVARALLMGRDTMEEELPYDLSFYENLVSGMVFSEEDRDWILVSPQNENVNINVNDIDDDDDDGVSIDDMSMGRGTFGEFGNEQQHQGSGSSNKTYNQNRSTVSKKLTPNQKATAWLLFHDERKDPDESVWRWAMASIYFKMGGDNWNFQNGATSKNKWFTSAPLCEWERLYGSSGCDKHKQQPTRAPLLPVELDFDDTNMAGPIAIEFALLLLPASSPPTPVTATATANNNNNSATAATINTLVRSITLADNRLIGTIPGAVFQHLMPSLGKLYLDNNQLTGTVPLELSGLGKKCNATQCNQQLQYRVKQGLLPCHYWIRSYDIIFGFFSHLFPFVILLCSALLYYALRLRCRRHAIRAKQCLYGKLAPGILRHRRRLWFGLRQDRMFLLR
jgi:hypothetical protein